MSSYAVRLPSPVRLSGPSLQESFRLRFLVWSDECTLVQEVQDAKELHDEHDEHAIHFGIFDRGVLVASSRCCIHDRIGDLPESQYYAQLNLPSPTATMNRLVVRREFRNRGYARVLDEARIHWSIEQGANSIICCGASERSKSLLHLGFVSTELRGRAYFQGCDGKKDFVVHYLVIKTVPVEGHRL